MKSCLIVYYSRSGVTAQVAQTLARDCGADLEQINDLRPRHGLSGYLRSVWEALLQRPAPIQPPRLHPADYPFVVLGTPVWAGHMSAPMRSYILQQREHFSHIALFCTMGGSGGQRVLDAVADLCRRPAMATLCLRQSDVLAQRHLAALQAFAGELPRLAQAPATGAPSAIPPQPA